MSLFKKNRGVKNMDKKEKINNNSKTATTSKKLTSKTLKNIFELIDNGAIAEINELLEDGIDLKIVEKEEGFTPLIYACVKGKTEIVKILIDAGSEINFQNHRGVSALHVAAFTGNTEISQILISNNANLNLVMKGNDTPLQLAAQRGHTMVVDLLVKSGCDINNYNDSDYTALMIAAEKGHSDIISILKNAGTKNPPWMLTCYNCRTIWTSPSKLMRYKGMPAGAVFVDTVGSSSSTDFCPKCGRRGE